MSIDKALKVGKIAVWVWVGAVLVFLVLAMVYGPELS